MKMKDDTLALIKNPYLFISTKCRDKKCDVFETRMFLQRAYCMSGKEAARLFYESHHFVREKASPELINATLFGKGGIQNLDGPDHENRKLMFMSLMTNENAFELKHIFLDKIRYSLRKWSLSKSIILYDELQKILTESACKWMGIPLDEDHKLRRTKEIVSLFDSSSSNGAAHFMARISRMNAEDWIKNIVIDLRSDGFEPLNKNPLEVIVWHRDLKDELLPPQIAAVEILNLLRPTVAVSVFMVFIAHAINANPDCLEKLESGDEKYVECFLNEVRRFYPFFPAIVAKVKEDFTWRGIDFKKGARTFLDIYGTNNDPLYWESPQYFWPERFESLHQDDYQFIPQGGGNPNRGHKCPGELFTMELMKAALNFFLFELDYEVPEQNLNIEWSRLPALPVSRFIMKNIRPKSIFTRATFSKIEISQYMQEDR